MPLAVADALVTPEEFMALPDAAALELVDGQIVEKNVSSASSRVGLTAGSVLRDAAEQHDCYAFDSSLSYRCFPDDPDKFRRPDLSVVSGPRFRALGEDDVGVMPIVPDLAVEVISKNDIVYDVSAKVAEYLGAGFPLLWVLSPPDRTVTVYQADADPVLLSATARIDAGELFPGWSVPVADLFPRRWP